MALRNLIQAKVICANAIHELETINGFSDEWDTTTKTDLADVALEMHLGCQQAAAESNAIVEILEGLLVHPASAGPGLFTEIDVRRENAINEVGSVQRVVEELAKTETNPELSLREIGRRAQRLCGKLQGLKALADELERLVQVPANQERQGQLQQNAVQ